MSLEIEKTGKTVDEAKQAAILELGVDPALVEFVEVVEPTKGFLGLLGGKPARVRAVVRELSPIEKAEKFLGDIFKAMKLDIEIEKRESEDGTIFNLIGDNLGILIGKHGQTLDSLQYLSNLAANRGLIDNKVRVIIDIENYHGK